MNIYDLNTLELLPNNLKENPDIIAACKSADTTLNELSSKLNSVILVPNVDNINDEKILDHLAVEERSIFYVKNLEISKKKSLIRNSINIHRKRGTKKAVEDLATTVFGYAVITEWFEYGGLPYHFKVLIDYSAVSSTMLKEFNSLINSVKNVRSILEAVEISMRSYISLSERKYKRDVNRNTKLGIWRLGKDTFATPGSETEI